MSTRLCKLLLPLLLLFGAASHASSDSVAEILAPFKEFQVFDGQFEQRKILPVLNNPFVSKGEFVSVKGVGLIWKTTSPVASKLVMTPGKLVQKINGRQQTFQASGSGFDGLAILLPSLLDGDIALLEDYFNLSLDGNKRHWSLKLTPASEALQSMLKQVSVHGEKNLLREITLSGTEGDVTRILFQSLRMSKEAPDAVDLADFK